MGLIPPYYFDCVVAIGLLNPDGQKFEGIASGFLYGDFLKQIDADNAQYAVYLITNRHVFSDKNSVWLRFNPQKPGENARSFYLPLEDAQKKPLWFTHENPEVDIAIIPVNMDLLMKENIQTGYFQSNRMVANIDKINDLGIMEGDFVYVLGFPMGIVGEKRNAVIARGGTIARIQEAKAKDSTDFMIDAFVFPGNSGGPVISKPELTAIGGTKNQNASYLLGIVRSYISYEEVAISAQTKKARIIFEENSGLASVHPVDFIQEVIKAHPQLGAHAQLGQIK